MRVLLSRDQEAKECCRRAVAQALDLRNQYYNALGSQLALQSVLGDLAVLLSRAPQKSPAQISPRAMNLAERFPALYRNRSPEDSIDFDVCRIDAATSVLDPRILRVRANRSTEYHAHAHESLFVVLEGTGSVRIGEEALDVRANDVVYVPRWVGHQTINNGDAELVILAITDFGLTRRFSANTETSYRLKQNGLAA